LDELYNLLGQRGFVCGKAFFAARYPVGPPLSKLPSNRSSRPEQESLAMSFSPAERRAGSGAQSGSKPAGAVRDFQQIVAQGISTQLLEWKGIEATEMLAKSPNCKKLW